jgi:hypothetical protein
LVPTPCRDDALEGRLRTEIEHKTDAQTGCSEVVPKLSQIRRLDAATALDLDDDFRFHHAIRTEQADSLSVEPDFELHFSLHAQARIAQHHRQGIAVHRLEEPVTELRVNRVERTEDDTREVSVQEPACVLNAGGFDGVRLRTGKAYGHDVT